MNRNTIIDIVVVSGLFAIFVIPSPLTLSLSSLTLDAAWFLLPVAYLALRRKKNFDKILPATLVIGLLAFALDILLVHNLAWTPYRSTFSWQIFGVPPEEVVWFFLHIFYIIVWYEHFVDDEATIRISGRFGSLALFGVFSVALAAIAVYAFPAASRIPYAYSSIAACTMLPILAYALVRRRLLVRKILPLAIFFALFALVMEITAVRMGLWSFPNTGNYLGLVTLCGATFPIEEIIFWMTLGPGVAIMYYELYADDGR